MSSSSPREHCLRYQYTPLNPTDHEIRLVRVHPATQGLLRCDMIVRRLYHDDNGSDGTSVDGHHSTTTRETPYEAVSYAWGSAELCETVWIDGRWLGITASVFELLSRLRTAGTHEYLWIDAICINQLDDVEKSYQVQQMSHVYASARRVIFHLGRPTEETELLMEGLWRLQRRHLEREDEISMLAHNWAAVRRWLDWKAPGPQDWLHNTLHELVNRDWFERVWIIQEVCNARDGIVHCGSWAVTCDIFIAATTLLGLRLKGEHCYIILMAMPLSMGRRRSWLDDYAEGLGLYELLLSFRMASATDERDKIYALLGLRGASMGSPTDLLVDYTADEPEVVRSTTAYICGCSTAYVPCDPSMTISSFLDNLESLPSRVFGNLLQSTDFEALHGVMCMLERRSSHLQKFEITDFMIRDAVQNEVRGLDMLRLIRGWGGQRLWWDEAIILHMLLKREAMSKIDALLSWKPEGIANRLAERVRQRDDPALDSPDDVTNTEAEYRGGYSDDRVTRLASIIDMGVWKDLARMQHLRPANEISDWCRTHTLTGPGHLENNGGHLFTRLLRAWIAYMKLIIACSFLILWVLWAWYVGIVRVARAAVLLGALAFGYDSLVIGSSTKGQGWIHPWYLTNRS